MVSGLIIWSLKEGVNEMAFHFGRNTRDSRTECKTKNVKNVEASSNNDAFF